MNHLETGNCCFVMIDMQEKLLKAIPRAAKCLENQALLLKAAAILEIDSIVTEQYPQGLGGTADELKCLLPGNTPVIAKTSFSCCGESAFRTALKSKHRDYVVVFGIEAHVCVQQTVMDLLEAGYKVIVAADALASRNTGNCRLALDTMRRAGAFVTSSEAVIFMLLRNSRHPSFREISKLIK
ncbi:MAG: isochorismatase family protein [Victivallaceae bacterium]|nr:isochorismatase family protein [Victivallaceae bacterium]